MGRELKIKQILYEYKYSLKWYFSIKASCICPVFRVYFMLKRYISFIKLEKESKML